MAIDRFLVPLMPELILLIGACLALIAGVVRGGRSASAASLIAVLALASALLATMLMERPDGTYATMGLWLTSLTHYARLMTLGMGLLIVLVNWSEGEASERGEFTSMILFSLLGVLLTASANDWLVLFLCVELVSVPTYVLIALSRVDARASEASLKYFFLGALAAALLAYGFSFLYGVAGTTAIHQIRSETISTHLPVGATWSGALTVGFVLVLVGLFFKIAAVPFHAYAPDVYEGAASGVTGMLGFVPKFAGMVALIKLFAACNWSVPSSLLWILWGVAALTMTAGNVLALLQGNVKRMLAYSSIAHTGYMLIALLVGPVAGQGPMRDGVSALFFYIAVYGAMNLGAFALLSAFRAGERKVETLDDIGGLAGEYPLPALTFAVCVFSLMGFPPTAGFLGKVYIFSAAFSLSSTHPFHGPLLALAIIGVVNTAIGAAYYLRIVAAVYMGTGGVRVEPADGAPVRWGLVLCGLPMLVLFVRPADLVGPARRATAVLYRSLPAAASHLTESDSADSRLEHPERISDADRAVGDRKAVVAQDRAFALP